MDPFAERLGAAIAARKRDGLYRQRITLEGAQGPVIRLDGRELLNFCSNDYLGLAAHPRVTAVSPLFGGKALKGPADRVMATLGLSPGNQGVAEAYRGVIDTLIVDSEDADDHVEGVRVIALDTRISEPANATRFARDLVRL